MKNWKKFTYEIIIRAHHLDTFGHVNNAAYLQIFEEARWDILINGGFGLDDILSSKLGPVILEVNLKFLKEMRFGDKILIHSQIKDYSGKVSLLTQEMRNESDVPMAVADFKIGLFDLSNRKLVMPTEAWIKAVGG